MEKDRLAEIIHALVALLWIIPDRRVEARLDTAG